MTMTDTSPLRITMKMSRLASHVEHGILIPAARQATVEAKWRPSKEACTRFRNSTADSESRPMSMRGTEKSERSGSPWSEAAAPTCM